MAADARDHAGSMSLDSTSVDDEPVRICPVDTRPYGVPATGTDHARAVNRSGTKVTAPVAISASDELRTDSDLRLANLEATRGRDVEEDAGRACHPFLSSSRWGEVPRVAHE